MRKILSLSMCLYISLAMSAQNNVPVKEGAFSPNWESLNAWECPEWFKDAKFGIWAHWGPQCQAEDGDWYGRFMYYEDSGAFKWNCDHFGNPSDFGLKDLCNAWKADQWNPEELVGLYKSVGARYFFTLGNHHDNMDLWDSPYQEWNSVNLGPKKDIVKGWSDACKKYGLPLGVSMHASHAWTWLEKSTDYDGNLTKEDGYTLNTDGTEKWWKGLDPQELYAQRHEHSTGWKNSGTIHSQWGWQNGASLPSEEYKQKFQNRVLQCINDYRPDVLYFDDTVLPFYGCDESIGLNILAHYYNTSAADNDGKVEVVVTGKILEESHKDAMMWDVERGVPDRIQEKYWQTCTCLGDWHYSQAVYNRNGYKSAQQVVDMLVDIVSKNGNMLLNVPVRGNGTIDDKERAILADIKAWMDINGNSIYGTRPWKTFGEGPLAEGANPINAQGFNEGNNYSANDVRFVQRNDTVFATIMRWPAADTFTFKSFGYASKYYSGKVKSIELLGYGPVQFSTNAEGVKIELPGEKPNPIAPVFSVTFDEDAEGAIGEVVKMYSKQIKGYDKLIGTNTGKFSKNAINEFKSVVKESKKYTKADANTQRETIVKLAEAYSNFMDTGKVKGGSIGRAEYTDITASMLGPSEGFARKDAGTTTRFATPRDWTVENFNIPNGNDGVKNGIDRHPGYDCLMLGVWNDIENSKEGNLANARIYKKVHLKAGRYYFGANYNTTYSISNRAYIFASSNILATEELPEKSIAYYAINNTPDGNNRRFDGIFFTLGKEQDVYLGFQADLTNGSTTQEFRVRGVRLAQAK